MDDLSYVVDQAVETCKKNDGTLWDTYFYRMVLGGSHTNTIQALELLEEKGLNDTLDWLLHRGKHEIKSVRKQNKCIKTLCWLTFMLVSLIITPIFYVIHILTNAFCNQEKKRISCKIELPLAYAAFSQNTAIIEYFLSHGVSVDSVDKLGNNVFHYVADLSSGAETKAVAIFQNFIQFITDQDTKQQLLIENRNSAGLTAIEYVTKFGSPALLNEIINYPELMKQTAFSVSDNKIKVNATADIVLSDEATKLEFVDVSIYEAGSITDMSALLNLLSDRNIAQMSESDLKLFDSGTCVSQWMNMKIKQMLKGVLFFQLWDFVITAMLLYALFGGNMVSSFWEWGGQAKLDILMDEFQAISANDSTMFKPESRDRILDVIFPSHSFFLENINKSAKQSIFDIAANRSLEFSNYFNHSSENWNFSDSSTPQWIYDKACEAGLKLPELNQLKDLLILVLNHRDIVYEFAAQIEKNAPEFFDMSIDVDLTDDLYDKGVELLQSLVVSFRNISVNVGDYLDLDTMISFVCIPKSYFNDSDFLHPADDPLPESSYEDSCEYIVFKNFANDMCDMISTAEFYVRYIDEQNKTSTRSTILVVFYIIFLCSVIYIIIDVLERCVFMYTCVIHQSSLFNMFITVLGCKLPGSYARKQLNVMTYLGMIAFYVLQNPSYQLPYYKQIEAGRYIFLIGLVLRFLMHIHTMRLLPSIGRFIITTFMMGTNLLHFSAVFGLVMFIFSVLFYILSDDPDCPLVKHKGFSTLYDSMFSTFTLTFGHGDFDAYFLHANVKLTYTLYVIISGLLLLNLIIAIMSSTAETIMSDSCGKVLWKIEWLDEATSVEYTFNVLTLLLRRCVTWGYLSHKNAGFVVKKEDGRIKIYIEVFRCPAIE